MSSPVLPLPPIPEAALTQLRAGLRARAGSRLCVALSGGLDSMVLLDWLCAEAPAAGCALSALHVDHGLSPNAAAWAAHCVRECAARGVPLQVVRVQVAPAGRGLEAAAREARHAALAQADADWIVLAHHANDQAETLLLRLTRGCGVAGAAAMRESDAARRLWRPLLGVSRAQLEAWAQVRGLCWVEDESNARLDFARNRLRHTVLPALQACAPAALTSIGRACAHFAEAQTLLDALAAEDLQALVPGAEGSRERWRGLGDARRRNLLRAWLASTEGFAPDTQALARAERALAGEGAHRLQTAAGWLCAYRERIWLEAAPVVPAVRAWQGESELPWGAGCVQWQAASGQEALRLSGEVCLAVADAAARWRVRAGGPSRAFKQLCQEAGLPAWWRESLPVLCVAGEPVWLGGVGVLAAAARCAPGEAGWRLRWRAPDGCWR